jgi:hypothetical protein
MRLDAAPTRARHETHVLTLIAQIRRWSRPSVHPSHADAADHLSRAAGRSLFQIYRHLCPDRRS